MIEANSDNFKKEILDSPTPVVADFYADWCGPCKAYAPVFAKLADKLSGKAKFVKVNVDNAQDFASRFGIMSIPATVVFKKGKNAGMVCGIGSEQDMEKWIKERL